MSVTDAEIRQAILDAHGRIPPNPYTDGLALKKDEITHIIEKWRFIEASWILVSPPKIRKTTSAICHKVDDVWVWTVVRWTDGKTDESIYSLVKFESILKTSASQLLPASYELRNDKIWNEFCDTHLKPKVQELDAQLKQFHADTLTWYEANREKHLSIKRQARTNWKKKAIHALKGCPDLVEIDPELFLIYYDIHQYVLKELGEFLISRPTIQQLDPQIILKLMSCKGKELATLGAFFDRNRNDLNYIDAEDVAEVLKLAQVNNIING